MESKRERKEREKLTKKEGRNSLQSLAPRYDSRATKLTSMILNLQRGKDTKDIFE